MTSYKFTGQREEASLGLYYYGARWYDPALGRFIQPDTIVPNPRDAQAFDRYAYVFNNPLKYTDPSGHTGVAIHDSNDGPPVAMSYNTMADIQEDYYNLGVSWTNLPHDVRTAFEAQGATGYMDFHGNATSQNGTIRDPAVIGASLYGVGRLIWRLPAILTGACLDDGCEREYRTYEMAVRRVDPVVSFQKLGGFSRDVLTKGYHLNSEVGEISLLPQRLANGTIQIAVSRAGSTTGAITNNIVAGVSELLQSDSAAALQRAQGIISTFGSDPRYAERVRQAQLLIEAITKGNYTVVK